jgi:predicted CoA-binding protein
MHYLQRQRYRAIPVNPNAAGTMILGETCYASLADLPRAGIGPIDMVDIFRRSEAAGTVVDEAIALAADGLGVKAVWMQLGVVDTAAASRAEANGIKVVMHRCPAIEIPRLGLTPPEAS